MESTPVLSVPPGLMIGVIYSVFESSEEILECLFSCNSTVLKVEKLLTYLIFIFGAVSPGQLVYSVLKNSIDKALIKFTGSPLEDNSSVEQVLKTSFFFIGVRGLEEIWDYVRESSLCLMLNNCNHDFLIHISSMKSSYCGGHPENKEKWNSSEGLPLCEQLFNDLPLITLTLAMIILNVITNFGNDPNFKYHLPEDEMEVYKGSKFPKESISSMNDSDSEFSLNSSSSSIVESDSKDNSGKGGPGGHQIIYADCPDCKTAHAIKVPSPLVVECSCTASKEVEVINKLKPKLCKKCIANLEKSLPPKSSAGVCSDCGQEHG